MVWRVDVRVNPADPPWGLTASGAPQAGTHDNDRWRAVGRLNLVDPPACGGRGKARRLRRQSTSSWRIDGSGMLEFVHCRDQNVTTFARHSLCPMTMRPAGTTLHQLGKSLARRRRVCSE